MLREVYCPPVNVVCFRWSNVLNIISYLDPPETLCLETEQSALFGRDIMPVFVKFKVKSESSYNWKVY